MKGIWHTLLLIYTRVLESTIFTSTCFQQLFTPNRVFLFFPPKTESDHFFPPKLKSTDLVGLSGQKPNWLGSFRAKSDFWKLN